MHCGADRRDRVRAGSTMSTEFVFVEPKGSPGCAVVRVQLWVFMQKYMFPGGQALDILGIDGNPEIPAPEQIDKVIHTYIIEDAA